MNQKDQKQPRRWNLSHLDMKKYEREGVDISSIISHLNMTATERLENALAFLKFVAEIRKNNPASHQ